MARTTDSVALNEWFAVGWPEQTAVGVNRRTRLLGQEIEVTRTGPSAFEVHEVDAQGRRGRALPVTLRYELIFTTLGTPTRPIPEIAEFAESDRIITGCGRVGVHASPYRVIENFLDMAHFPFVHLGTLGGQEHTEVVSYRTEHRKEVDEIWAVNCQFYQPGSSAKSSGGQISHYEYRVMSPFSATLYKTVYDQPDRMDAIGLFVQPLDETDCLCYMQLALVDSENSVDFVINFQQGIFLQDRVILENQRPALLPLDPTFELPTRADAVSIAYRRWLKAMDLRFGILERQAA